MAQLIVRNLEESTKTALKQRAARRGTSMESEARAILESALGRRKTERRGLIQARFAKAGKGIELPPLPGARLRRAKLPR